MTKDEKAVVQQMKKIGDQMSNMKKSLKNIKGSMDRIRSNMQSLAGFADTDTVLKRLDAMPDPKAK